MTMPFRDWMLFDRTSLRGGPSPFNAFDSALQWSNVHYDNSKTGWSRQVEGFYRWDQLWRPKYDFEAVTSLDIPCSCNIELNCFYPSVNDPGITEFVLIPWLLNEANKWDSSRVTGRNYDGTNNWGNYPQPVSKRGDSKTITVASLPEVHNIWLPAYFFAAFQLASVAGAAAFFKNGILIRQYNYVPVDVPAWNNGDEYTQVIHQISMRVRFFNPVVNSMSRYQSPTAGGVQVVITGLGFHNSDADIEEGGGANPAPWNDAVSHIYFVGLQGQGTTTITKWGGDFTVDSNMQITISSMPVLAAGTYEIKVEKNIQGTVSYAGDYSCDEEGRVFASERFTLQVKDDYKGIDIHDPEAPIILTKWRFKEFDGDYAFKQWSPIDTACPSIFYDGRLKSVSGLSRAINDDTGLYVSPDIQFEISNTDKEISKILASHYIKDEPIDIFLAFRNYPESFKVQVFRAFVEDVRRKGDLFYFDTRDVTTVYFNQKVPRYRITTDDYPNCHQNFVNKPMPEGLGLGSYIASEASGYMEAAYVDTTIYRFLAARGSLKSIDQVYKDGVLLTSGVDYSVVIADGGKTYIDLTADPESSKITFNFKGYIYAPWNSVNGYVQHPVYIILFYLTLIMEIPIEYIDIDSFEAVKDILDSFDSGIATSGHLGIQSETNAETIIKELILPIGVFFPDMKGRLKLMKKDITNIATSRFVYAQIDAFKPPEESWGLKEAVNNVKGVWNFAPAAGIFQSSKTEEREETVFAFCGHIQEDPDPMEMKWISSSILAEKIITDTLYKRGAGRKTFKVDIHLVNMVDLDIYSDFRLQDPFGVSASGGGYIGRYCYIEKIDYDWTGNKMSIVARDLGYILRAYLMLGSEDDHQDNWSSASDEDKTFAYLAKESSGEFANGEKGKILVSESYMG